MNLAQPNFWNDLASTWSSLGKNHTYLRFKDKPGNLKQNPYYILVRNKLISFVILPFPRFPETSQLQPPILGLYNASFNYPDQPPLFKKVDFGIDMESRVAIVGTFSNLG